MADKLLSFTAEKIDELLNKVNNNETFTSEEKEKLASLENYTHPPKHEATIITEDATHRFVTDAEKNKWNNKAEGTHIHEGYAEKSHNHTKANITDFAHTHNKSEITDFTHKHTKSDISDYTEYTLPKATSEVLGGVKIGDGINVSEGTISLGEHEHTKANISDFAHTHNKADISDFTHKHTKSDITDLGVIPTKVSQLTNDSNFATETFVTTKISEAQLNGGSDVDLSGYATKEELKTKVDKVEGKSLLEDTEIARLKTLKNYNDTEIKGMINNKADKTSLHSHANIEELNKIAVGDKAKWDAKSDFDGDYNSLENKPDNDLTNELKSNYDKAYTHSQVAHAPATAQKNSDITKAEIEAKLIGNITTHEHNKYALTSHNHSDLYEPKIAEKKTAFNKDFGTLEDTIAKGNHTHANYSETTHNHDKVYAKQSETYTKLETDGKIAEEIAKVQVGGEVDLSAYATKVELQTKADKVHTHDGYASSEHNHNDLYEPKIATKKTAFNKDFGKSAGQVAEGNHTHEGFASADHTHEDVYASISHNHNSLYANKSSEHTHTNKVVLDKISDEKINEWNGKADGSHTHEGFAATSHKHDEVYSKLDHNHSKAYEPIIAEKKTAFNKDFGTAEGTVAEGNHTHDGYATTNHNHDTLYSKTSHNHNTLYEPLIVVKKSAFNKDFGTGVGQVAEGNHTHEGFAATGHTHEVIDNLTSTSTTVPLSANQGKILKEKVDEVFQSVSNGKGLIASAITDKGVETSNTDTFEQMATNISNIQTGVNTILDENDIAEAEYWKKETIWSNRFYGDKRTTIPLLNSSHVEYMGAIFKNSTIKSIPLLNTKKVLGMNSMFEGCRELLEFPPLDTSGANTMSNMFSGCSKLKKITRLDTSSVSYMSDTFSNCHELTHIRFNPNATNIVDFSISSCTKMTREDLIGMFESLPTISKSVRITLGTTLLEKLTEEDKLIANNKGYTLA